MNIASIEVGCEAFSAPLQQQLCWFWVKQGHVFSFLLSIIFQESRVCYELITVSEEHISTLSDFLLLDATIFLHSHCFSTNSLAPTGFIFPSKSGALQIVSIGLADQAFQAGGEVDSVFRR